jgi:hypothetical protein
MKLAMRTVVLGCVTAAALYGQGAALAQVGGNGNGGLGSGNAHGAATSGMTYHGDPVSGPFSPRPDNTANRKGNQPYQPSMSPDNSSEPAQRQY